MKSSGVKTPSRSLRASELPPGFEPDPPLSCFPEGFERRSGGFGSSDVIGSGKLRWCACRVFGIYKGPGKFSRGLRGGETVSVELLRPHCDYVTRKVFASQHVEWITDLLCQAGGYGYQACILPDTTPMDAYDAAEKFGLTLNDFYRARRDKVSTSKERRAARFAALKPKGASDAVRLADDLARLV